MFATISARVPLLVCVLVPSLFLVGCPKATPKGVAVPEVVGLSLGAAGTAILDAGLTINTPSLQHSDATATDHVIAQTPAAGEIVPRSTIVSLVVSLGPMPVIENEPSATAEETGAEASDAPPTNHSDE